MLWSKAPAFSATSTLRFDNMEISPAASLLRSASFPTSLATTANPLPCSPARAASMLAFSDSMLVERAISSIMAVFSTIWRIATTVSATASAPCLASFAALAEIRSVWAELSAFCLIFEPICSMLAETSSALAACSVAPWDSCWLDVDIPWMPLAICLAVSESSVELVETESLVFCAAVRTSESLMTVPDSALARSPVSSLMRVHLSATRTDMSPVAMASEILRHSCKGLVMLLVRMTDTATVNAAVRPARASMFMIANEVNLRVDDLSTSALFITSSSSLFMYSRIASKAWLAAPRDSSADFSTAPGEPSTAPVMTRFDSASHVVWLSRYSA